MAETEFRPNVEKGARWLEEQGARDWPDKILAAVEEARFNMAGCSTCAVGVTLGMWTLGLFGYRFSAEPTCDERLADHNAAIDESDRLGFSCAGRRYAALEAEWISYAREEQAARKAAQ